MEKFIIVKMKQELSKLKWMTEHEIRERNSPLVVDCIINTKKLDPQQWRPNPDCPDCPEGIEYLVSEYDGVSDELRSPELSESSLRSTLDPTSAAAILPQRLQTMTSAAPSSSGALPAPQAETSGGQGVQTSVGQEGNGQRPAGRELTARQLQLAENHRIEKQNEREPRSSRTKTMLNCPRRLPKAKPQQKERNARDILPHVNPSLPSAVPASRTCRTRRRGT